MVNQWTDEQIVRVFELCERVVAVRGTMPPLPVGFKNDPESQLELARSLRSNLEKRNADLLELEALLRVVVNEKPSV
jgi:hypothetical protein